MNDSSDDSIPPAAKSSLKQKTSTDRPIKKNSVEDENSNTEQIVFEVAKDKDSEENQVEDLPMRQITRGEKQCCNAGFYFKVILIAFIFAVCTAAGLYFYFTHEITELQNDLDELEEESNLIITSCDELMNMESSTKAFKLFTDIDCITNDPFIPIEQFSGILDGDSHKISNLNIICEESTNCGLFGEITSQGRILNLDIDTVKITSLRDCYTSVSHEYFPTGLIGRNEGSIENVTILNAEITSVCLTGLMAGLNNGEIENCSVDGILTSTLPEGKVMSLFSVGLFVGKTEDQSLIRDCSSSGKLILGEGTSVKNHNFGGFLGENEGRTENCSSAVTIESENLENLLAEDVGGFVGENQEFAEIKNCSSTGDVMGYSRVGGLCGKASFDSKIELSSSSGTVKGSKLVGGLIGWNLGNAHQSSSTSDVSYHAVGSTSEEVIFGGLVGQNEGEINQCFSKNQITGNTKVGGGIGENINTGSIKNSYYLNMDSGESITGSEDCAGFVVQNEGTIENCYTMSEIDCGDEYACLVGEGTGAVTSSFYAKENCALDSIGGLDQTDFSSQDNFPDWDSEIWDWTDEYPILSWENPL